MELKQFKRLIDIYDSKIANINDMLRIDFQYNKIHSFILYQNIPNFKYTFSICWLVKNTYFFQNFHVKTLKNGTYHVNPFLDPFIYKNLKNYFIEPNPMINYFTYIFNNLDKNIHLREPKNQINQYTIDMPEDYIFFHYFTRKNMTPKMKKKLTDIYKDSNLINQIENKKQTTAFTNDIFKARNIYIEYSLRFK